MHSAACCVHSTWHELECSTPCPCPSFHYLCNQVCRRALWTRCMIPASVSARGCFSLVCFVFSSLLMWSHACVPGRSIFPRQCAEGWCGKPASCTWEGEELWTWVRSRSGDPRPAPWGCDELARSLGSLSERWGCPPFFLAAFFWVSAVGMKVLEYYSAVKRKGILTHATTWPNLGDFMLSEISQIQKDKYCMIPLLCGA